MLVFVPLISICGLSSLFPFSFLHFFFLVFFFREGIVYLRCCVPALQKVGLLAGVRSDFFLISA